MLHRTPYFFFSIPEHLDLKIFIWHFPVASDLVKCPHLISILIPSWIFLFDNYSSNFLTTIDMFSHEFYLLLQELLYLRNLMDGHILAHKGVTCKVQWINLWEIMKLDHILTNGKYILFLGIVVFGIRVESSLQQFMVLGSIPSA